MRRQSKKSHPSETILSAATTTWSSTTFFFRILCKWPNTYTLTKALAEGLVRSYSADLPIGVFRPAIGKYWIIAQKVFISFVYS